MNKDFIKFTVGFLAVIFLAIGGILMVGYYQSIDLDNDTIIAAENENGE